MSSENPWALILGSSSGFGEATARALAEDGYNIAGVHFDRKSEMDRIEDLIDDLRSSGAEVKFFNQNAASESTRDEVFSWLNEQTGEESPLWVMMHSLAFGTLKKYVSEDEDTITEKQMDMTLNVMAHTLVYWTQELLEAGLMSEGGRIYAMTSGGSDSAWPYYGAVSAAKAALESHMRQLAVEVAEHDITVNCIQAGVTDTPSLRKIPASEWMIEEARRRNPSGRLTTPEDVADLIRLLVRPESHFVTGNIIRADGGEDIVA